MAILSKCAQCGREGGYAENANDKICARCKRDNRLVAKDARQKSE